MPKRIQRRREKGWRMPDCAVYVGRPTKWGNPFVGALAVDAYRYWIARAGEPIIPAFCDCDDCGATVMVNRYGTPLDVRLVSYEYDDWQALERARLDALAYLEVLSGKDLACWCPLDKPCHADVLLELAND